MASANSRQITSDTEGGKSISGGTVDIGQFNGVATSVLSAIDGLGGIAAQINAAATAAGALAAFTAILAVNKAKEDAISAIKAAASVPSGNADNPKFQEPHNSGYGPNLQPPD